MRRRKADRPLVAGALVPVAGCLAFFLLLAFSVAGSLLAGLAMLLVRELFVELAPLAPNAGQLPRGEPQTLPGASDSSHDYRTFISEPTRKRAELIWKQSIVTGFFRHDRTELNSTKGTTYVHQN